MGVASGPEIFSWEVGNYVIVVKIGKMFNGACKKEKSAIDLNHQSTNLFCAPSIHIVVAH